MAQIVHPYVLQWSKMIAPKVLHLSFEHVDKTPLPFIAGQFITLHIPGPTKVLHRSYSIANAPNQGTSIEMACSYVEGGVASELLFNLKPGDIIHAAGPYGLFVLKDEQPTRYILIATGTGVTPYRSMLKEIKQRLNNSNTSAPLKIALILGVRHEAELLFKDEFLQFAAAEPNFEFYGCYSREENKNLNTFERHGYVQTVFDELKLDPLNDIVYLCGNPNMIDQTFELLTAQGFDRKSVRREKYLFSH